MTQDAFEKFSPQVEKELYFDPSYLTPERMASYAYQYKEIIALKPKTTLEIGVGTGILTYALRKAGIEVTTLDLDPTLESDIVASVTAMPLPDNSFDIVACFQILEHLPFEHFGTALAEIKRVTRGYAVISLPDAQRYISLRWHLPRFGDGNLLLNIPMHRSRHVFAGEHYWEIDKRGYPLGRINKCINALGFKRLRSYRLSEHPYHRMFVLGK